jgi:hypothetical protein
MLFPAINTERFGGDPRTPGFFMASFGVGTMVAMAFSGPLARSSRRSHRNTSAAG